MASGHAVTRWQDGDVHWTSRLWKWGGHFCFVLFPASGVLSQQSDRTMAGSDLGDGDTQTLVCPQWGREPRALGPQREEGSPWPVTVGVTPRLSLLPAPPPPRGTAAWCPPGLGLGQAERRDGSSKDGRGSSRPHTGSGHRDASQEAQAKPSVGRGDLDGAVEGLGPHHPWWTLWPVRPPCAFCHQRDTGVTQMNGHRELSMVPKPPPWSHSAQVTCPQRSPRGRTHVLSAGPGPAQPVIFQ
jgi:hypothetical protein